MTPQNIPQSEIEKIKQEISNLRSEFVRMVYSEYWGKGKNNDELYDKFDEILNKVLKAGQKSVKEIHYLGIPIQRDKNTTLKADKIEWIDIGWNEIEFKIPKEYNHQLIKEFEQIKQEGIKSSQDIFRRWLSEHFQSTTNDKVIYLGKSYTKDIQELKSQIAKLGGNSQTENKSEEKNLKTLKYIFYCSI